MKCPFENTIIILKSFYFLRKLKMYEEQELTMQVFSEPEISALDPDGIVSFNIIHTLANFKRSTNNKLYSFRMTATSVNNETT